MPAWLKWLLVAGCIFAVWAVFRAEEVRRQNQDEIVRAARQAARAMMDNRCPTCGQPMP